jgi:uncharacterized membrane protein
MFTLAEICFLAALLLLSGIYLLLNSVIKSIDKKFEGGLSNLDIQDSREDLSNYKNLLFYLSLGGIILFVGYKIAIQTGLEAHLLDWLNLIIRWAHIVFGIAWIGASFYFIFLENSLNRTENLRDELAGNLWAVHGGGFYYVEKYKTAPVKVPENLHWFKYEAYFTWLSGFLLLTLVYYLNAGTYMIDTAVKDIQPSTAVLIGLGSLIIGWLIYDVLCRTSLLENKKLFAFTGFTIVTAISFFLSQYLSGRAAFMHVGALLGTIMVGNVFFVIIPSQKALVKAAKEGRPVDPALGKYAGLRSLHNNYITLPVIFVMISNHFPVTFSNQYNWIILAVLTLASVAVRHYINLHEKGQKAVMMIPFAAVCLIALAIVTAPKTYHKTGIKKANVAFSTVQPIFIKRCTVCHSATPSDPIQATAPNGIMFDTPEQIKKMSERILVRAVQTKTMPQANKTGITEEERTLIGDWIEQGAKIE